ncbi:DUF2249 domain-containing protein [Geoglobus acetivorans]|uniref:DUF2249 domain-containing protein n=1 Tax=Geoglobus acetivorans TaxID=565033 RepID=A0ABZ3H0W7_GEOAI|nr:DUF2249 domain-containing protein [Geoglobus acetivorans]
MEIVDVRGKPHPERPPLILQKLKEFGEVEVWVEVEPKPLMAMLKEQGYTVESSFDGEKWVVRIRK